KAYVISRTALVFDYYHGVISEVNDTTSHLFSLGTPIIKKTITKCLQAIREIHKRGIIHLDIKPNNFLYNIIESGQDIHIAIGDFGLSKIVSEGQNDIKNIVVKVPRCGTHYYRAPEIYKHQATAASDIYSFAIMLIVLLTRKDKFKEIDKLLT